MSRKLTPQQAAISAVVQKHTYSDCNCWRVDIFEGGRHIDRRDHRFTRLSAAITAKWLVWLYRRRVVVWATFTVR